MPEHRKPKHKSARDKLKLSRLDLTQMEAMGNDIDLESFYLEMKGKSGVQAIDRIVAATITRTIEGASTLEVSVKDIDHDLLNSPLLHSHCDVNVDGLWFRLCKIGKQQDILKLTFEDREVAVLRTYSKPIKQSGHTSRNSGVTRAEFILRMLNEVQEFKIPWVIPELHKVQAIEGAGQNQDKTTRRHQRQYGVFEGVGVTVKGKEANAHQIKNINTILDVAVSLGAIQPVMIATIMAATQESSITNLPYPKPGAYNYLSPNNVMNPRGVFQQIKFWGWPASGDVAKDAHEFIKRLMKAFGDSPTTPLGQTIDRVQNSGTPELYQQWKEEAKNTVSEYFGGDPGNANMKDFIAKNGGQSNEYEFYRGKPHQRPDGTTIWRPESSWECIQRLAGEVNKIAFMVSGTFYYVAEPELFKSVPTMTIHEDDDGIDYIEFDWDINKSYAECEVSCEIGRWAAPPGSVVVVRDMGHISGRWLVQDVERSLYDHKGTITLIKAQPKLPEPSGTNVTKAGAGKFQLPKGRGDGGKTMTKYQNPFAKTTQLAPGRTDMGVDYHGVGPILALGDAKIIGNGGSGWYGNYLVYRLTSGQLAGRYVYIAEAIVPKVKAGDVVQQGDVVAEFGLAAWPGQFPGIEMGWSTATLNLTWAKATTGYTEGQVTEAGKAFARLLKDTGAPVYMDPGPGKFFV